MICTISGRLLIFNRITSHSIFTVSSRALVSGFGLVSFWALASAAFSFLSFAEAGLRPRALRPDVSKRSRLGAGAGGISSPARTLLRGRDLRPAPWLRH